MARGGIDLKNPEKVDPNCAKAEYQNGMLRLTAAMAKAETAQRVQIKAA